MNIAAYCRVSTDKSDQLNSLETQKQFFNEYTQKNGHNLVKIYADEGISGTKIKKRKEFLQLMQDAEHGLFDMVVVKDISRFARNTVDFLQSIRALKALGIETTFLTSNQTVLGNSEFVLTIFGALAQEESANTSKRVKFGKKVNAEKGRVPNIVYGYDKIIGDYYNLSINEPEAKIIKQIFDLYLNEGYGANKISQILNEQGTRTKRNCRWSQNAICRILSNELYTGVVVNGKEEVEDFLTGVRKKNDESEWIVVERPDLKIIEPELYEKAQTILKGRLESFNIKKERQSNKHLFSTLIKCKECGYSFRRVEKTYKNTYVRWVCIGRNIKGKDCCHNTTKIDEVELIQVLQEYFADLLRNRSSIIDNIVSGFVKVYKTKDGNAEYEKQLNDKYSQLKKNKKKYMDMYTDDLISRDEVKENVSGINVELEKIENELKIVQYNLSKGDQLENVIAATFKEIEDVVSVADMTNAQLKRIIKKIEVDNDGNIDIYLNLFSNIGLDQTYLIGDNRT